MDIESDIENIGTKMKTFRKLLGLSQEKLAELCGWSRQYVSKLERAQSDIGFNGVLRVCRAFSIDPVQLLARFDEDGYIMLGNPRVVLGADKAAMRKGKSQVKGDRADLTASNGDPFDLESISRMVPEGRGVSVVFQDQYGIMRSVNVPLEGNDLALQTAINLYKKGYRGNYLTVRVRQMLPELIAVYEKYR